MEEKKVQFYEESSSWHSPFTRRRNHDNNAIDVEINGKWYNWENIILLRSKNRWFRKNPNTWVTICRSSLSVVGKSPQFTNTTNPAYQPS